MKYFVRIGPFFLFIYLLSFCLLAQNDDKYKNYFAFDISKTTLKINNKDSVFRFIYGSYETAGKYYYDSKSMELIFRDTVFNIDNFELKLLKQEIDNSLLDSIEFIIEFDLSSLFKSGIPYLVLNHQNESSIKLIDYSWKDGLGRIKLASKSEDSIFFKYFNSEMRSKKIGLSDFKGYNRITLDFSNKIIKQLSFREKNQALYAPKLNRITIKFFVDGSFLEKKMYLHKKDLKKDIKNCYKYFIKSGHWIW